VHVVCDVWIRDANAPDAQHQASKQAHAKQPHPAAHKHTRVRKHSNANRQQDSYSTSMDQHFGKQAKSE
jgi:hypothetical protein